LVAVLALLDLVGGADDGVGELRREAAGLFMGERGGLLDPDDRVHERRERPLAGDREVLSGPLGLDAVERRGGNRELAERVLFDAGTHRLDSILQTAVGRRPGITQERRRAAATPAAPRR